jgi:hypothetical protein
VQADGMCLPETAIVPVNASWHLLVLAGSHAILSYYIPPYPPSLILSGGRPIRAPRPPSSILRLPFYTIKMSCSTQRR